MKPLKEYTIQFVGLKQGTHLFEYNIDNTFFKHFEYDDFNAVDVAVAVNLTKKTTLLELQFTISGTVNVNCDVTNEPFNLPINNTFDLVVKFGEDYNDDYIDILILPHGEYEFNIQQYIYELTILAVPAKRIHPGVEDGTLQSDILDKLEELSINDNDNTTDDDIDPRWDTLKNLLTDK